MWEIVSNPKYVDPAKGSIHNRGGAVDITLVDANNRELDMGTPFDFFLGKRPAMVI
jgi:D-alanyl-D-alanine dipeptidase